MMQLIRQTWSYLKEFPQYLSAVVAGASILAIAIPFYLALWYFLHRRKIVFPAKLQAAFGGVFVMFAGLAFLFASPLATQIHSFLLLYLFITCLIAAYCIVALLDIFLIEHYLMNVRKVYISPPLRKIIDICIFVLAILPILHYVLNFNPFTLVAIPTIATAGLALAFQDTLKAFIAGVGLGNMIRVGDWVGFQDKEGRVIDINWGRTVLRTLDGDILYVPNTLLLTQPFLNYSNGQAHRMTLKFALAYSAAPEKVKEVMERCADQLPGISDFPAPSAQLLSLDGSVSYAMYYWIEEYGNRLSIQDKLASRLWEALRREKFEVLFPFATYTIEDGFHPPSMPQTPAAPSAT